MELNEEKPPINLHEKLLEKEELYQYWENEFDD